MITPRDLLQLLISNIDTILYKDNTTDDGGHGTSLEDIVEDDLDLVLFGYGYERVTANANERYDNLMIMKGYGKVKSVGNQRHLHGCYKPSKSHWGGAVGYTMSSNVHLLTS